MQPEHEFRYDGPEVKDGVALCYVLHQEYENPHFREPDRWIVSAMISETDKTWMRPLGRGGGLRRAKKDLIIGRYPTLAEARAARRRAVEIAADVKARADAVRKEMEEACRPFKDRLTQLSAELADRTEESLKP